MGKEVKKLVVTLRMILGLGESRCGLAAVRMTMRTVYYLSFCFERYCRYCLNVTYLRVLFVAWWPAVGQRVSQMPHWM